LDALERGKTLRNSQQVVLDVIKLLVPSLEGSIDSTFKFFSDSDGKLRANSSWFFSDAVVTDRLATYKLDLPAELNIDAKMYGVRKANKSTISWVVGLTPNFEDEPFNSKFNVGIDFVIPDSFDRVIVAISKNYVVRTLELRGKLTATFLEILTSWCNVNDLSRKDEFHAILWNSLDLHPINKRFYEGISQRFVGLRQHLQDEKIFDPHHAAQFANRLIGRVIFTWFIDKKGLVNREMEYLDSNKFLDDTEYYRSKLEPLFFEVLNTAIEDRSFQDGVTPYLNGGLFEPKSGDLYRQGKLHFPKNYFDDLFAFLQSYNFTTDESTSEFQQVAIDPEMLGRIFENLLAEINEETGQQARKAKGAFYTPRLVVDFMCKEALKGYLRSRIEEDDHLDRRLYQLIDATEREFQDQDHNWRRDLKPYKEKLIASLDDLRILDPACGSGAFPIGMMQLLVKVFSRLDARFDQHKAKLSIIEKNIFGVDIEPMAVEISRLRAWLALVVDVDSSPNSIRPLPNLEFKFVCANSLLYLDDNTQVSLFEDHDLDLKLQEIREAYFSTQSATRKSKLKEKYSGLVDMELSLFGETKRTSQLKSFRPFEADAVASFFDANQMFGVDDFHIVIGNPPYVNVEKIDKSIKAEISKFKMAFQKYDLYVLFYERSIGLLAKDGVISFITSNKFLSQGYGKVLREELLKMTLQTLVNFEIDIFDSATVRTCIVVAQKTRPTQRPIKIIDIRSREKALDFANQKFDYIHQEVFTKLEDKNFRISLNDKKIELLEKISKDTRRLEEHCSLNYGLRPSGKDEPIKRGELLSEKELPGYKPYFEGKNMGFWNVFRIQYLKYEPHKMYNPMFPELFSNPKLVGLVTLSEIGKLRFVFDEAGLICNHSVVVLTLWHLLEGVENSTVQKAISEERISTSKSVSYPMLQGLLNSNIIRFFVQELMYDGTHFYPNHMKALPVPAIDQALRQEIEALVIEARALEMDENKKLLKETEHKLDALAARAYGLSDSDLEYIYSCFPGASQS
jgi:type I restriction-modification system DNA methylase subunit